MCILNLQIQKHLGMKKALLLLIAATFITFSGFSQALDFSAVQASVDFSRTLQEWDGFGFNYVETAHTSGAVLDRARQYLEQQELLEVNYVLRKGSTADIVLETAMANECNLLFMGGFGFRSITQMRLGSWAEHILVKFPHPMWICR